MKLNKISILLTLILIVQISSSFTILPQIRTKIKTQDSKQDVLKMEYDNLLISREMVRAEYTKRFLEDNFSEIEIRDICKSQITTYIEINGEIIKGKSPKIALEKEQVKIRIVEQYNDLRLPIETVKIGGIINSENLKEEPAKIYSTLSDIKTKRIQTKDKTYIEYEIKDLNPGEIITLHITHRELLERLELERGVLEVIYAGQ